MVTNMQSIVKVVLLLAAITVFGQSVALTQTTATGFIYTFPKVEAPGLQLAIANISTTTASVRVNFLNSDGTVAVSPQFSLASGFQTILDDVSIGGRSFSGPVVVESGNPLSVTASTSRSGTLENVGPSTSGTDLIIPFVRAGNITNTVVSVLNPTQLNAQVGVLLATSNGTVLTGSSLVLGPLQSADVSLNGLGVNLDSVTHVIIRSLGSVFSNNRAVFAVATITNFDNGNGVVRADPAVVQALPVGSLGGGTRIPVFIRGFGYFTRLQVVNASNSAQSVTLTAFSTSDAALSAANNPITVSIPGNGSFSGDMASIFGFDNEVNGSVAVSGTAPLAAVALLGTENSPNLAVIDQTEAAVPRFTFQFRSVSRQSFYGLSLLNSNSADVGVTTTFITNNGTTISRAQFTLPARSHLIKTLSDLLPEAEGSGFLFVQSDQPIQARAIEGSSDGAVLSSLPASPVTSGFNPNPQNRFLAVGTATIEGVPLPGATVTLTGPVSLTRLTDSVGAFVFRDIPPGQYTLTIQMSGITFTPASISFTITDENSRGHLFEGSILGSTLTSITPTGVLAGSPQAVTITARGGPFIPTSEIVFEGSVLPTTFVNETTLTATLPVAALQVARQATVQVRNRVGQSFSPSGTLIFSIGNPAPVVTSVTGIPVEIVVGHPGFTATFIGNGFSPGGTVEVDGIPRAYVFDSPTQVRAFIGPADLAVGRIAKLTATNPAPTVGASNATNITVLNPIAGVLAISPTTTTTKVEPNALPLQLTVDGFSFKPGAVVKIEGFDRPLETTFVSSTRLVATIPPQALEKGGSVKVDVTNPAPTLGTSEALGLLVYNLLPQLASVDAGPLTFLPGVDEASTVPVPSVVVLHGSNFGKTNNVLWITPTGAFPSCNGLGKPEAVPSTRISSTEFVVVAPIKCTGSYQIYVSSNQAEPGGGTSQVLTFVVTGPPTGTVPVLSSLSPAATPRGIAFTLTINGNNFLAGAVVNFGTAVLVPASITTTAITVAIPSYLIPEAGIIPVTVTNPGIGGTSTRLLFSVN
jgi:hypothetical protein